MKAQRSKPVSLFVILCCAVWAFAPAAPAQTPPALSLRMEGGQAWLSVTGVTDMVCQIQWTDKLSAATRWSHLGYCVLSASPSSLTDSITSTTTRYYRAVTTPSTNFVWISPGTFRMGSPTNEVDRSAREGPQTVVTLTRGFWMGKYEVTQAEYQALIGSNPSSYKGSPQFPVEQISWNAATNYCAKLTESERLAGRLPDEYVYRLPTEAEWEWAARAGTTTRFSYGDDPGYTNLANYAWHMSNSVGNTHPVGQKMANPWGLYDMYGNVQEWCWDHETYTGGDVTDPREPSLGDGVTRGGGRRDHGWACRSASRYFLLPAIGTWDVGFRVVLAPEKRLPPEMVWLNPGAFTMGSPDNEANRRDNEGPQTVVTLTRGFWMGKYEVTQAEYQAVMGGNLSFFKGDPRLPVETVSWSDATNYCALLTTSEQAAGRLPVGWAYRLPTEAEWEYATRAGTTTRFSYGDDPDYTHLTNYAWYWDMSGNKTHPAGQKLANAWNLYDMSGNVWEWCLDWYGTYYPGGSVTDPEGPGSGSSRVVRGGSWTDGRASCRCASRLGRWPDGRSRNLGFRVVLAPDRP